MNKSAILCAAVAAFLSASAQCGEDAERQKAVERGTAHYLVFCANCHGVDADGRGPLLRLLKVAPTDLTLLRSAGGGQTVAERVLMAVDGRHPVGESGERKMPVFSENLEIGTVIEIAEFLETVQK